MRTWCAFSWSPVLPYDSLVHVVTGDFPVTTSIDGYLSLSGGSYVAASGVGSSPKDS